VFSKADIRTAWQIVARKRLLKNSKRNGLFPVPRFITYGAPNQEVTDLGGPKFESK
jgi:hypothetical protein